MIGKYLFASLALLSLPSCVGELREDAADDTSEEPSVATANDGADEADPRGTFELTLCVAIAADRVKVKEAFCRSLKESDQRGRCWSHRFDRPIKWINWCIYEF
ncbi:hypothetical protein WMF28_28660 [Sorangium sp. So ce590]|uniref:hypothetical protein n=1 Tax=Sorangium sp. So ce590 TaxID=3133317 RepID=UPI003F5DBE98